MKLNVLIACEFSGIVRRAFRDRGHDAWSCDLLDSEDSSPFHIKGDARELLVPGRWDLLIAHPPCTRLTASGVRWLFDPPKGKTLEQMWADLEEGAALFGAFLNAPVPRIAVENPVMHHHAQIRIPEFRKYSQSVQPWQFGHGETKRTCLWLKNLPLLVPTNIVAGREHRIHKMSPGPNRGKERSRFYPGIAAAMADQWGGTAKHLAAPAFSNRIS